MMKCPDTMLSMENPEILQKSFHANNRAAPFFAAIVGGESGDLKLVIMFDEQDYTAVLSLDALIGDEGISADAHKSLGDIYDDALRDALWYSEINFE
jgi:hypothetical protein